MATYLQTFADFLFAPLDLFTALDSPVLILALAGICPLAVVVFCKEVIRWCTSL